MLGSNVELELPLAPTGSILGRVVTTDGRLLSGQGERVVAALVGQGIEVDPRAPDQTEVDAQGNFAVHGLFGERRLRLIGLGEEWELRSVRLANGQISDTIAVPPGATISDVDLVISR